MAEYPAYLLPEEQFRYLLRFECKRAQRYQFFFSLITVEFEYGASDPVYLDKISNMIKNSIRDCDTMGALQYNKLAILLCFTDDPDSISKRIINKFQFELPGIKIKVGEVCFPLDATTADDLVRASLDRLL